MWHIQQSSVIFMLLPTLNICLLVRELLELKSIHFKVAKVENTDLYPQELHKTKILVVSIQCLLSIVSKYLGAT